MGEAMAAKRNHDNTPNHTSHLFNHVELAEVVNGVCYRIKKIGGVEAVAVCGFSGIIPGTLVAHLLGINLIAIRKASEEAQADNRMCNVEYGSPKFKRWVILDDLIATGTTLNHIVESVAVEKIVAVKRPTAIILHTDRGKMWNWTSVPGCKRRVPIHRVVVN
jgi:adenine/guanine phosphoribosyltransferase-like PRPP-binding protein